jgi:hypothetical protein
LLILGPSVAESNASRGRALRGVGTAVVENYQEPRLVRS